MVYIPSLRKKIFPIYLKPKHDELFTSWVCRLSNEYNLKPYTFLQNYLGVKNFKSLRRDLDLFGNSFLVDYITDHTPLQKNKTKKMFLSDYSGKIVSEFPNTRSIITNILPLGISNRNNKYSHGIQYCPNCLSKSIYYKKNWRLITSLVCLKCYCYLKDKCDNCNSPINFMRIFTSKNTSEIDNTRMDICYNCKESLVENYRFVKASEEHINYQRYINGTINKGYNDQCCYSFFYIKTLLHFAGLVKSDRNNNKFREYILDIKKFFLNTNDSTIEYWSFDERLEVLPLINHFLSSEIKLEDLKFYRLTRGYIDSDKKLPYWIYRKLDL